jgi:mono/diheme cytochrome c family protein
MRFLAGVVVGVLLVVGGVAAYLSTGSFDASARQEPGLLEKLTAGYAVEKSVAKRAPDSKNPLSINAEVLNSGMSHYRANCVICHGAPGVKPGELAAGLNPPAPDLADSHLQEEWTDGDLFWIVSNGIRMTGMPAFGPTHNDQEVWKIVAFVRRLPQLSGEERQYLQQHSAAEEHHHHGGEERSHESGEPEGHSDPPGTPPHKH